MIAARRIAFAVLALVVVGGAGFATWRTGLLDPAGPSSAESPADEVASPPSPAAPPIATAPSLQGSPISRAKGGKGAPPAATAEKLGPPSATAIHVTGTLQGEDKKPAAGVGVKVSDEAREYASGTSGADGKFDLWIEPPPGEGLAYAMFRARDATRAAYRTVTLRGDRSWPGWTDSPLRELGTIVLKPAAAFDVVVTDEGGAGVAADVRVVNANLGLPVPIVSVRTDAAGKARIEGLPAGGCRVAATAAGHGRATAAIVLPLEEAGPVRLVLPAERRLDVIVVEEGTEAPVAGAIVYLMEDVKGPQFSSTLNYFPPPQVAPTDAAGRTRIEGLAPSDLFYLRAEAKGFVRRSGGRGRAGRQAPVKPTDTEAKVTLAHTRTVEWPVVDGERPVPPDGTVLTLKAEPGSGNSPPPPEGRMVGRRLVVEGLNPEYVNALAYGPDGSVAVLWCEDKNSEGRETSFRAVRKIEVTLTYPDEKPAEGWSVMARNQGNNPMGPPAKTDASGKAVLDGMHGQLVEVYAGEDAAPYGGTVIGSVDLEKGSGHVEATVERTREIVIRIRISGRPSVPEGAVATVNYRPLTDAAVDEAGGAIRGRFRPTSKEAKTFVYVQAAGYLPANVELPPAAEGSTSEVTVDLEAAGRLLIRVTSAEGQRSRLQVQKWDEAKREWTDGGYDSQVFGAGQMNFDAKGVGHIDAIPAGRYRAFDVWSGSVSGAADVVAGAPPAEIRFDISASGVAKGRVIVPEGFAAREVRVLREGGAKSASPFASGNDSSGAAEDGAFQIRVPGNVAVTLRPMHPFLVPAPEGGTAVVTEPREGIVLRMVRANTATVRFDREPRSQYNQGSTRHEKALLYRGEPKGPPAATLTAVIDGSTARFGGFEPGTWTVWLDVSPFVPLILRDVVLGVGETDLGTAVLSEGGSVHVTVRVKEGQAVPRINVWATRTGEEPAYTRGMEFNSTDFRLSGLGAGTFQVRVGATMGSPKGINQTIESDGTHEVPLTLDLR